MNKVVTINLQGIAVQLEEAGYDALRAYLDGAARQLAGNPDRDEIIADIEQAIADKCRAVLGAYKTVVGAGEIAQIIQEMGPVENASGGAGEGAAAGAAATGAQAAAGKSGAESPPPPPPPVHRLYKVPEGAMVGGVCNGIAAYFGIDVTIVRILFVLLTFFSAGVGILVYLLLMILVPSAGTSGEKAAAYGMPATAQEFIRRAKEGYYEGMRTLGDKRAHREWRRRFRREMHVWGKTLKHEMRGRAEQWRQEWYAHHVPGPATGAGMLVFLPFLALLRGLIAVIAIVAIVSLAAHGNMLGVTLPHDIPVWIGIIGILLLWGLVNAPLKMMRHACFYRAAYGPRVFPPVVFFGDSLLVIGVVVLALWLLYHFVPDARHAFDQLPALFHQLAETIKAWWTSK